MKDSTTVRVVPFHSSTTAEWDAFVESCSEAYICHLSRYVEASLDGSSYSEFSFAIMDGDIFLAICVLRKTRVGLGNILSGPGVAISDHVDRRKAIDIIKKAIVNLSERLNCQSVAFHIPPMSPGQIGRRYFDSSLAQLGFSFGVRGNFLDYDYAYVSVINLGQDNNTILKGFTKGNRADVTRCKRNGMSVVITHAVCPCDAEWHNFLTIHVQTFERNGLTPFDKARFTVLRESVQLGYLALVNAYDNTKCIASILIEIYKGGAYYLAGGCQTSSLSSGVMAFIHYSAMLWAKERGVSWYCMGSTAPASKTGYGEFKKRFGGEKYDLLSGELVVDRRGHLRKIVIPCACGLAGIIPPLFRIIARSSLQRIHTVVSWLKRKLQAKKSYLRS
ncbi:MAG: GNAT family N-acetyltransferase [Rhodospirillaceae bacterium]